MGPLRSNLRGRRVQRSGLRGRSPEVWTQGSEGEVWTQTPESRGCPTQGSEGEVPGPRGRTSPSDPWVQTSVPPRERLDLRGRTPGSRGLDSGVGVQRSPSDPGVQRERSDPGVQRERLDSGVGGTSPSDPGVGGRGPSDPGVGGRGPWTQGSEGEVGPRGRRERSL